MPNPIAATAENWPVLQQLYADAAGFRVKETGDRARAMVDAAEEVGALIDPPMTGLEFRTWNAKMLRAQQKPSKPKAAKQPALPLLPTNGKPGKPAQTSATDWVAGMLPPAGPTPAAADDRMPIIERARLLLADMQPGEARIEVCLDQRMAESFRAAVSTIAKELNWGQGGHATKIVEEITHQAGQPRVLVAVRRMR